MAKTQIVRVIWKNYKNEDLVKTILICNFTGFDIIFKNNPETGLVVIM